MASRHMKRCSVSLTVREMQIKTPIRTAIIKKSLQTINTGEDMGKREPPDTVGGNISWNDRCREQPGSPSGN